MGEDAFDSEAGTIPQRLLLMNGTIVNNKTKPGLFNAAQRIATQAPSDRAAVELAYLTILTRRPTRRRVGPFLGEARGHQKGRPEPADERSLLDADQRDGVFVESLSSTSAHRGIAEMPRSFDEAQRLPDERFGLDRRGFLRLSAWRA